MSIFFHSVHTFGSVFGSAGTSMWLRPLLPILPLTAWSFWNTDLSSSALINLAMIFFFFSSLPLASRGKNRKTMLSKYFAISEREHHFASILVDFVFRIVGAFQDARILIMHQSVTPKMFPPISLIDHGSFRRGTHPQWPFYGDSLNNFAQ